MAISLLSMKFGWGLAMLVMGFLSTNTMAYEIQAPSLLDDYDAVQAVCSFSPDFSCLEQYETIVADLEKNITSIWELVDTADDYHQPRMRTIIADALERIAVLEQDAISTQTRFMLAYMHLVLQDMELALENEANTFTIAHKALSGLVHTNKLGRPDYTLLRRAVIDYLVDLGYDRFITQPYGSGKSVLTTSDEDRQAWSLEKSILAVDDLDRSILQYLSGDSDEDFVLSPADREHRGPIYLFKTPEDLQALGYRVISHRSRANTDAAYRRHNISQAFAQIGNLSVLNPGQEISYMSAIDFDPQERKHYQVGTSIVLDQEKQEYGGGLCGGSTALYQGVVLNRALTTQMRNHSKRYSSLYDAKINGVVQTTPGMDSSIYNNLLDLTLTNTASYPIILAMNYDGSYGEKEEVFTMTPYAGDLGEYALQRSWGRSYTIAEAEGTGKVVNGKCYERMINDKLITRCYKEVF